MYIWYMFDAAITQCKPAKYTTRKVQKTYLVNIPNTQASDIPLSKSAESKHILVFILFLSFFLISLADC